MRKNPQIKWRALLACCGGVAAAELSGIFGIAHAESFPLWDGNVGNWSDPTHWIPNGVPNNGNDGNNFDVIVTGGAINLDIPVTIDSLSFSNAVISGSSTLSILQLLNWNGGVFGAGGRKVNANGGIFIGGTGTAFINHFTLMNASTATWAGGGNITLSNSALLDNRGTFNAENDKSILVDPGRVSLISNSGVFNKSSATNGMTTIWVPFNNSGTVSINSGGLKLMGGGTETGGVFNLAAGTALSLSNGTYNFDSASQINGAGTVLLNGGTVNVVGSGFNIAGPVTLSSGGIGGSGLVAINGQFNWTSGKFGVGGGTTVANGGLLINTNAIKTIDNYRLVNGGTATWSGVSDIILRNGAILENRGTLNATSNALIRGEVGSGIILNNGVINKASKAFGSTRFSVPFNNNGTVNVNSGTLELTGGGRATRGVFNIDQGGTLAINSGIYTLDPMSTLTGAGIVSVGESTLNVAGSGFNVSGTVSIGGRINFNGASATGGTVLVNGTIAGSGAFDVTGPLTWTEGDFGPGGGTTTGYGGLLISGSVTGSFINAYRLVNAGTAKWSGIGGGFTLSNGAILENRGTFNATNDANIATGSGAASLVINSGIFNKSSTVKGTTTLFTGFNNSGTVNVNSGTLRLAGRGVDAGGTYHVAPGANLRFDAARSLDSASSITGGGTTTINAPVSLKNLNQGSLVINSGAQLTIIPTGARSSISTDALNISSTSLLDLQNNFLALNNTVTPYSRVTKYINAAYNLNLATGYGDYKGRGGITSTVAQTSYAIDRLIGVGYYDGSLQDPANPNNVGQIIGPDSDSGRGTGIPRNQILIRPTLTGDLNGDGVVNAYDVSLFNSFGLLNNGTTQLGWQAGDLNGDGVVNSTDVSLLNAAINANKGQSPAVTVAAKPAADRTDRSTSPQATPPDPGSLAFSYDPATGNVKIHYNGFTGFAGKPSFSSGNRALSSIHLKSTGGPFALDSSKLTPTATTALSTVTVTGNTEINLTAIDGNLPDGTDLGPILPAHLDATQLADVLTLSFNYNGSHLQSGAVAALIVPEPIAFSLVGFGTIGLMSRNRKNSKARLGK